MFRAEKVRFDGISGTKGVVFFLCVSILVYIFFCFDSSLSPLCCCNSGRRRPMVLSRAAVFFFFRSFRISFCFRVLQFFYFRPCMTFVFFLLAYFCTLVCGGIPTLCRGGHPGEETGGLPWFWQDSPPDWLFVVLSSLHVDKPVMRSVSFPTIGLAVGSSGEEATAVVVVFVPTFC